MADKNPGQAVGTIQNIQKMANFLKNPVIVKAIDDAIPHSGITRAPGALGFDVQQWVGLGIVGIWAALDAYAARAGFRRNKCPTCKNLICVSKRFEDYTAEDERESIEELEDMRHLYAHNYGGDADSMYFSRDRHILRSGEARSMTSGGSFNGRRLHLQMSCLEFYSEKAQSVLRACPS